MAGDLVERLRGRVVVAHNWPFDAMHLHAEFARLGVDTPFHPGAGICMMRAAARALPGARRSLIECCAAAGLPDRDWHTARDDARAAADLLGWFLCSSPGTVHATSEHLAAAAWAWPMLPSGQTAPVHRPPRGHVDPHFLAWLVDRMPRVGEPATDAYLATLDSALLDRQISATEADALLDIAHDLGLHKRDALAVHERYVRELARAVWTDGVLTDHERQEVETVGTLLAIDSTTVERILAEERTGAPEGEGDRFQVEGLRLAPGDKVVLTGSMQRGRAEVTADAEAVGLVMTSSVSRRTTVVVAADPDSLSGKAKSARSAGVPVVSEESFMRALASLSS